MRKRALITGINGQDGSYLAEYLLQKNYDVYGLIRRTSVKNTQNIDHIVDNIKLISGDITDQGSIFRALLESQPDEVYNLAAQSFVGESWAQPVATSKITGIGALNVFEAVRLYNRGIKVYQASSSEMFGNTGDMFFEDSTSYATLNEKSTLAPRSPYGVAKLFAHRAAINYRESHDMFVSCGILFNHESPRRGLEFVSRKITDFVGRLYNKKAKTLRLGNIQARRDFGFAGDYVEAMHLMLQQDKPDDFVIGTGQDHSVRDILTIAFLHIDKNYEDYVVIDEELFRPAEIDVLKSDPAKAKNVLNWKPKTTFEELITMMVEEDIKRHAV